MTGNRRFGKALKAAKLRFHLALGFLVWSVLPHFSLYLHAHDEDGQGHAHNLVDRSQIEQVQTLAASASAAFGEASLNVSFGLSGASTVQPPRAAGHDAGIAASSPGLHGHLEEEANASSTPWIPQAALIHPAPAPVPAADPLPSAGRLAHSVPARGPPSPAAVPAC